MSSTRKFTLFAVLMLAMCFPLTASAQLPTAPGVEIDCDEKSPKIDVRPPTSNPQVQITCTLTNPSSFEEQISVDKEWDGVEVEMTLEEDTFTLAAGEEEDFTVTFSGNSRASASLEYDFTLVALVTNVQNLDWPEQLTSNATVDGVLGIQAFGMVDLSVADKSTRAMNSGEEIAIAFQAQNNGNSDDDIRVIVLNQDELEEAGFSFPGGATVVLAAEDGGTVDGEFTLRSPSEIPKDARYQITLQASSVNDEDATLSETTLSIQLEANTGAGSLGGGLEEFSKDDAVLYGGIAAAGLFGIILVVALSRALRKRANSQPMYVPPVEVADEEESEDEFDFGDLDDDLDSMLDDVDDLDDVFADL